MRSTSLRRLAALVAVAGTSLTVLAAPAAAAETVAVEYTTGTGLGLCAYKGMSWGWVQTFTPATSIVVSGAAVKASGQPVILDLRSVDASGRPLQVLATADAATTVGDGFSKVDFAEPVQLTGGTTYGLGYWGNPNGGGTCIGGGYSYPGGDAWMVSGTSASSYNGYDFNFRIYTGGGVVATPPVITTPGDVTVEGDTTGGAAGSFAVTAEDATGPVAATCTPSITGVFAVGTTTVTCTATGATGLETVATFDVTVVDTTAPELTLPSDVTVEATSPDGATASFAAASGTDIVDAEVAVSCSAASGDTFALGTTAVSCSVADDSGNTTTGSFTVTVVDTTAPTLTLGGDVTVDATSPDGASASYAAAATDAVDGAVTPACSPAAGSTFAIGTTTVTCTATDAASNTSAAQTLTVTVQGAADQLDDLATSVQGVGSGTSLASKVAEATASLAAGRDAVAANQLQALRHQVRAQTGKKLSVTEAAAITADIDRILAVLDA